jgi:hypothetical protein
MKKIATVISAASLAVVSASAFAGDDVQGGNAYAPYAAAPYAYAPYAYAPYGYAAPVAPAVEMTEEQKQAVADQQARAIEFMQKAQQQAAEFYASQRMPLQDMHQDMMKDWDARIKEEEAQRAAFKQAYEARKKESKAAYEARRKAREEAYKARLERRNSKPAADTGA